MASTLLIPDPVTRFTRAADGVLSYPVDDLIRQDLRPHFDFESLWPAFEATRDVVGHLRSSNAWISDVRRFELTAMLESLANQYESIKKFNPSASALDNKPMWTSLRDDTQRLVDSLLEKGAPALVLPARNFDFEATEKALSDAQAASGRVLEFATSAEEKLRSIAAVNESAKAFAGSIAAHGRAGTFRGEATKYDDAAKGWRWAALVAAVVTIVVAGVLCYLSYSSLDRYIGELTATRMVISKQAPPTAPALPDPPAFPLWLAVQVAIGKLLVMSVLITATVWIGRIYRANRHNYVVNSHRASALETFDLLIKSAEGDKDLKAAVLLAATNCIFAPQQSAFTADPLEQEGLPEVLKVVRGLAESHK